MKLFQFVGVDRDDRVPLSIFVLFVVALAIGGGGSRVDILGQAVVRAAAALAMIAVMLANTPIRVARYRMIAVSLALMGILVALQLVPLPPQVWTSLPGRSLLVNAAPVVGLPQPWRPLNITPDAGVSTLLSLLVPAAMLMIVAALSGRGSERLAIPLLIWVVASALLALFQAAGAAPLNPLINGGGDASGFFANRNHQALFLAIGIIIAIFVGFERRPHWRSPRVWVAAAIATLLFVSILVSGSRSGLLLGVFAVLTGVPAAQQGFLKRGNAKKRLFATLGIAVLLIVLLLVASIYTNRALSIDRAATMEISGDFRIRALPTVWHLVLTYFPFGAGFGSFDAAFRIAEPFALLEPTYFNRAHNDLLEVVFEGGLPALIILAATAISFAKAAFAVFVRSGGDSPARRQGRLGALIVTMIVIASVSDYPVRTPIVMSILVIAGCWLSRGGRLEPEAGRDTLPV